jgi:hypothetical protein
MQEQKEKPILFNTEMVKAVLSGRKTQTRRVVKPQPTPDPSKIVRFNDDEFICESNSGKVGIFEPNTLKCPYGQVGDRLWVRETWQSDKDKTKFIYKADYSEFFTCDNDILFGWKPSIHMIRRASRINIEIVDIRIERVQDISPEDALSEGITFIGKPSYFTSIIVFKRLWDSINKKRGYGWDVNPWVWVVEFKVIK